MRLVVYGNFRKGQPMAAHIDALRAAGSSELVTLPGIKMYVVGQAPAVIVTGDPTDKIVAEIVEVDLDPPTAHALLRKLDDAEGVSIGLYIRTLVDTPKGKAVIYEYGRSLDGFPVIHDWIEWINQPLLVRIKALQGLDRTRMIGLRGTL